MVHDLEAKRSRRALLTAATGAAAATVAGALVHPMSALAAGDDGSTIKVGSTFLDVRNMTYLSNAANDATVFSATSSSADGHGGGSGVEGSSHRGYGVVGRSDFNSGVHGDSDNGDGVSGSSPQASGVFGFGSSAHGFGVKGLNLDGVGVVGFSGQGTGSWGDSNGGCGVYGSTAMNGAPPTVANVGVFGICGQDTVSVGVRGESPTGRGGVFKGNLAQIKLKPSSATSHPNSGQRGDLFVDKSGRLWFCKGSTTWKQIA